MSFCCRGITFWASLSCMTGEPNFLKGSWRLSNYKPGGQWRACRFPQPLARPQNLPRACARLLLRQQISWDLSRLTLVKTILQFIFISLMIVSGLAVFANYPSWSPSINHPKQSHTASRILPQTLGPFPHRRLLENCAPATIFACTNQGAHDVYIYVYKCMYMCIYMYKYVNVQTDHVGTVYKSCNAMNTTLTTTKTSVVHIWETILVPIIQDMSISRRCILTFGRIPSWVLDESTHLLQCYPQLWAEWYHQYPNTAERGEPI